MPNGVVDLFKIHTNDGLTVRVDLTDEKQANEWLKKLANPTFQANITGVSVVQRCDGRFKCPTCNRAARLVCSTCGQPTSKITCQTGTQYSISRPAGLERVNYHIERVEPDSKSKARGEKITCLAGDVRMAAMIHASQPSVRISLLKTGDRRYNPYAE